MSYNLKWKKYNIEGLRDSLKVPFLSEKRSPEFVMAQKFGGVKTLW